MRTFHTVDRRRSFTLVEMLVVIGIIAALAAILIVAVLPLLGSAKVEACADRIRIIDSALSDWKDKYPRRTGTNGVGYPRRDEFPDANGYTPSSMSDGAWLRFMLFPTNEEIEQYWMNYGVTEPVLEAAIVAEFLNDDGDAFIDPWGGDIHYQFPGRDHSNEEHVDGGKGANHYQQGQPDIWSWGENAEDDSPRWASVPNQDDEGENDDVGNWFQGSYN